MSGETREVDGTVSGDYSRSYFEDGHLGEGSYSWEDPTWRTFFETVADRVVAATNPATVLDVGAAKGLLVQALRARGVDARGLDVSEHAVATAHPDVREHLQVAAATDPIEGRYSLVTCIEVLEHLSPADAQVALDRICAATDLVLFSSSPDDHDEPTHVNTRPTASWVAWFAERGFFRRTDVDLSFLTPWAVLLERADVPVRSLVQRYEQHLAELGTELVAKRRALLESYRDTSELQDRLHEATGPRLAEQEEQVRRWEEEVLEARHHLLTTRDHIVGTEAEVARLTRDNVRLAADLARTRRQLGNVRTKLTEAKRRATRLARRLERQQAQPVPRPSYARRVVRRLRGSQR